MILYPVIIIFLTSSERQYQKPIIMYIMLLILRYSLMSKAKSTCPSAQNAQINFVDSPFELLLLLACYNEKRIKQSKLTF